MAFRAANRKNLYLNRKGHESEWEPSRLKGLGDFLEKMGLLSEVSRLPDTFFTGLNQAIVDSNFWIQNNDFQETSFNTVALGISVEQTDAANVLGDAIRWFFKDQGFPIIIAVQSIDPDPNRAKLQVPVGKGHRVYPNGLVMGGAQAIDKGRFVMYLHLAPTDSTFDPGDVNPSVIAANIGRKIRHEIVHTQQFEKRRRKERISRQTAKERYETEGDIPSEDAPRPQYLGSGMEIDAYAHEFAEELLDMFGKHKALNIIRRNPSSDELKALALSDTLIEYLTEYGSESFTKKLLGKIYTQILNMVERGLYGEAKGMAVLSVNGIDIVAEIADCPVSRGRGLMRRLSLDENRGMLFVFNESAPLSFWMKETYLPLSIAYLNDQGRIINIEKMTPLDLTSVISSHPAQYALEMNENWFKSNGVSVGDVIDIPVSAPSKRIVEIAGPVLRSLIREIMTEDPPPRLQPGSTIYCDMDGVLVDFAVGAITWVNELLDGGKILGVKRGKTFWKTLGKLQRELGPDWRASIRADLDLKPVRNFMFAAISANPGGFFADLLPLSDGVTELWPFLNGTGHTVKLLTAGVYGKPDVPTAEMGKKLWAEEHLNPQPAAVILKAARQKAELAMTGGVPNMLIDDKEATIQAWNLSGGIGILHIPGDARGTIHRLEAIGL